MQVVNDVAEKPKQRNRASRRARKTHDDLLKAALTLFTEHGIDLTSIEEITERADVGKGTFYSHFENKEAVVVELIERALDRLISRFAADGECPNLETAIEQLIRAHVGFFQESPGEFVLLFQGRLLIKLQRVPAEHLEGPYIRYLDSIGSRVRPFLPPGADDGRIRRFACALAGFVSGFFSFASIGMSEEERETSLGPLRRAFVATASLFLGK